MAGSMLEPWDEVIALQKERQLCVDDVQAVKASCIKDHSKKHPLECPDCWTRLLNRIRDRYLNSASKEWFSGRRPFLLELDTMFSKAHDSEVDLKTIERRILDEKKDWYRDKVKNLGLQHATKSPSEERALQQRIGDRSVPVDQLASELRGAFSDGAIQNQQAFNGFIDRLRLANSPQARNEAYIDIFFQPSHDTSGATKSQKYIEMVRNGTSIADTISAMIRDRHLAKGEQDQKQALYKKLEELKRAKAAHELDKARRDKARQDRARAAAPPNDQHSLPPCSVCSKTPDTQDFTICPLCQILGDYYDLPIEPTLFCSQECKDERYDLHVGARHECTSGQNCVRLHDEDVEMDEGGTSLVFCRECVETLGIPSIFCSSRCFNENFRYHRNTVHIPEWNRTEHKIDDEDQLEFVAEDKTKYHAKKIEEHFVAFDDIMVEWQRKMSIAVK
ncbi:uncharacterized protein GGS22DRAFT_123962 [Annulohypoxylon maeteangense]|uniref:uncharacterized protein n=1 Tax=Annulohypoxylon maeteangense TaxID=1927788 RepID=UPI002007F401|nr:uncharacterized protein GGS22DRAFT_123962 [Annulohypoxylon maeteangense]KAI0886093.1 hypothetical protein GGS22DRAFT_123962 [Annulohypoxylon maeteangense]